MIYLKFTSFNKNNIDELCIAFEGLLINHDISFKYTNMIEEDGILSFMFCNEPEKARSLEFDGNHCIGFETDYIAKEVLEPVLPRLKAFAKPQKFNVEF
jgi:hypothetical protein